MRLITWACTLLFTAFTGSASAFDLDDLSQQLARPEVVRGTFVQEKHLRALPKPLSSEGHYVMAREHGLLWTVDKPIAQRYRITAAGIERNVDGAWQTAQPQGASGRQNALTLALLRGVQPPLSTDFDLQLSGTPNDWSLQLVPRSMLLRQVFSRIQLSGGERINKIELDETQGDRTVMRLVGAQVDTTLSDTERHEFER